MKNDSLIESHTANSDESNSTIASGCSRTPKSLTSSSSTSASLIAPNDMSGVPNESIFQLSGNSMNSQLLLSPHTKPVLDESPTKKKIHFSSSSDEKHGQTHPDTQGFEMPRWCKRGDFQNLSSNTSGSSGSLTGQHDLSSMTQENTEPIFSGIDTFRPVHNGNSQKNLEKLLTNPCVDSQLSTPLNMQLSQDFSQNVVAHSSLEQPGPSKRKMDDEITTEAPLKKLKTIEAENPVDQANNNYGNIETNVRPRIAPLQANDIVFAKTLAGTYEPAKVNEVRSNGSVLVTFCSSEANVRTLPASDIIKISQISLTITPDHAVSPKHKVKPLKTPCKSAEKTTTMTSSSSSPTQSGKNVLRQQLKASKSKTDSRKLFAGFSFLLTSDSDAEQQPNSPSFYTSPTEGSEEETPPFERAELKKLILYHGGYVIKTLNHRSIQRKSRLVCISNKISRTTKFLYCVVVGIPILWDSWIRECIENNRILTYKNYIVPAGKDLMGNDIEQVFNVDGSSKREPYTPFTPLTMFVYMGPETSSRELTLLLETAGAERVLKYFNMNRKCKQIPSELNTDIILTLVDRVPKLLWQKAKEKGYPIRTAEWFIQCLANNVLYDADISPLFQYVHREKGQ